MKTANEKRAGTDGTGGFRVLGIMMEGYVTSAVKAVFWRPLIIQRQQAVWCCAGLGLVTLEFGWRLKSPFVGDWQVEPLRDFIPPKFHLSVALSY